jgi:Zn-dependent membrane protease YugP
MNIIFNSPVMLIGIVALITGLIISGILKSKFKRYSQMPLSSNFSGKEVAEKMLRDNNVSGVTVVSVEGRLTDNYNPIDKTINLSHDVYNGRNCAAAAIAAHETGHAVQHATAYSMLKLRSALVPVQNASAKIINIIVIASIFGGAFLFRAFPFDTILYLIIGTYSVMTLFSFVTLPVEFDASRRALAWISSQGVVNTSEYGRAKDALTWAALTYVVAALGSLATLLYYISLLNRR